MIIVSVEEYCHNCPEFETDTMMSCMKNIDVENQSSHILVTTTIECKHKEKCRAIYEYIKNSKGQEKE